MRHCIFLRAGICHPSMCLKRCAGRFDRFGDIDYRAADKVLWIHLTFPETPCPYPALDHSFYCSSSKGKLVCVQQSRPFQNSDPSALRPFVARSASAFMGSEVPFTAKRRFAGFRPVRKRPFDVLFDCAARITDADDQVRLHQRGVVATQPTRACFAKPKRRETSQPALHGVTSSDRGG